MSPDQFIRANRHSMLLEDIRDLEKLQEPFVYYSNLATRPQDDEEGYLIVNKGDHILFRFEVMAVLGKGSFAQVVQAFDHKNQVNVAIKINRNTEIDHKFAAAEARLLQQLMREDPNDEYNIVRMKEYIFWRHHQSFVFELLHKDLFQHISDNNYQGFKEKTIRTFTA